jgi:CRP-like cAMP-binding protein
MYVTISAENTKAALTAPLGTTATPCSETRLKAQSYLYLEGDDVDWVYQVISGVVRLTRLLADGRRQVIAFGYPGDIVGFPVDGVHHTDCEALTETRLQPYRRLCLENGECSPSLHRALLQAALREIGGDYKQFTLPMCRSDIADFLGLTMETVSRTFTKLRKNNIIAIDNIHTIIVLRPTELQALTLGERD